MKKSGTYRLILAVAVVTLIASTIYGATTSRLTGTVVDNGGVALPGVTVILTSDVLIGGPQNTVTDADGEFSFTLLPPGQYTVKANLDAFQPAEVTARVALDRDSQVFITMIPEMFTGEIIVSSEAPVIDTTRVGAGESYNEEFLQKASVGSVGRDYLQVIGNEAGSVGSGNVRVFGSVSSDSVWLIDGLNTTDPLTATFGTNFNFDAIQEVSIQTGGFEAEFGQALGGVVNLVTKSGGNELHGSLDVRYTDENFSESGDHFDPDENQTSFEQYAATLGGPILRDKLWFFVSVQTSTSENTPLNSEITRTFDGTDWIGKLTWQAGANHRLTFRVSGDPADIDNAHGLGTLPFVSPEAAAFQEQGGQIYTAELNSVLSDTLMLNAQIGINRQELNAFPMTGDIETSGAHNFDTGFYEVNYRNAQFSDRDSDQYRAALTWFVDDLAGSHEFKGGLELRQLESVANNFFTGDQYFTYLDPAISGIPGGDVNEDGRIDYILYNYDPEFRVPVTSTGDIGTAFVQDQWRPTSNLTLQVGVRYDTVAYDNTNGNRVADFDKWQPRVGFAWDITGDAKNVIRGNWGRFMHPASVNLADTVNEKAMFREIWVGLEFWCGAFGICDDETLSQFFGPGVPFTDPYGNEMLYYFNQDIGGEPFQTVDTLGVGSLRSQYMDQYLIGYQRALGQESAIELTYVKKETRDLIEDVCNNNDWAWGAAPPPDFDDDSTWTDPSSCTGFVITNLDVLTRDYEGLILKFQTRYKTLRLNANYTYSESKGTTEATAGRAYATGFYDEFPRDYFNVEGRLGDDREHRFKLQGFWLLPYQFAIGLNYFFSSEAALDYQASCSSLRGASPEELEELGIPLDIADGCGFSTGGTLLVEPRGNRRAGNTRHELDLQFSKGFMLGSRTRLDLILAAYNAFSVEQGLTYQEFEFRSPEWGTPTTFSQPRRWELGVRLEF